jgi:hypothetical protein
MRFKLAGACLFALFALDVSCALFPSVDALDESVNASACPGVCLEVEHGVITAPMQIDQDDAASGGVYVVATAEDAGSVELPFSVDVAGTYWVWCRVMAPSSSLDSFFVAMDDGPALEYDTAWDGTEHYQPAWQWTRVNVGALQTNEAVRTFDLAPGAHALYILGREMGSKIDRVIVTADATFKPPP